MPIPAKFTEAIKQEFGAFYQVSELPESWDNWLQNELDQAASSGADRMRQWLDDSHLSEFIDFLREESQKRRGGLVQEIELWTNAFWSHRDDDWNALQEILSALADQLEQRSHPNT